EGTKSATGVGTSAQMGLLLQPVPQITVEADPLFTHAAGETRFAAGATAPGGNYVFGQLRADSASLIVRATYLFTPRLSLQLYAQLFVAAGHYSNFQTFPRSAAGTPIRLSALSPSGAPATNPDFEQGALNANVVLRWEYRLGSILYLVYSRSQAPQVTLDPGQPASLTTAAVVKSPAVDVILLKANFWWSR
ncbi:MAG TPA: hypothetical protein VN962_26015, partial [Polyangia bacterium]|nr:hypothetical protein [Polyangia bacterium]